MFDRILDKLGDWNPQLFRELKGQLKPRGLIIVGLLSFIGQLLIYLIFASKISTDPDSYSPYVDLQDGVKIVNRALWSADIFVTLSFISFLGLLIFGAYLLTADLVKESHKGTLNFIRMSPPSAVSILVGKILGVPALLYWGFAIAFPFHFAFGIAAGIPWYNLIGFDLIIVAACACFYSLAILIGLFPMQDAMGRSLPFGVAALVLMYLYFALGELLHPFYSVYNFWLFFHPGLFLKAIAAEKSLFFMIRIEGEIPWFPPNFLTQNSSLVIFLGVANYTLWTYWLWQGIKRRFHNNQNTLWSKIQSYRISASFVVVSLGFALASIPTYNHSRMEHIAGVQILYFFFCMVLTVCITPDREQVRIWALHRPQYRRGWASFIFDEKSPAILAIGINGAILYSGLVVCAIAFAWFPNSDNDRHLFLLGTTLACIAVSWVLIVLIASVYQAMLLNPSRRRAVRAKSSLLAMVFIVPLVIFFEFLPSRSQPMLPWLFTPFSLFAAREVNLVEIIFAFVSQSLAIAAVTINTHNSIRRLGASEAQVLLNQNASTGLKP